MPVTVTASRGLRVGNEAYLQGAETLEATNAELISDTIPAATPAPPVAVVDIDNDQAAGFVFIMDTDGIVKMHGLNYGGMQVANFTVAGDLVLQTPGELTIAGDLTSWLHAGDTLFIVGATTQQHDGVATVMEVAHAAGLSTIGVSKDLVVINGAVVEVFDVIEAGVVGTTLAWKFEPLGAEVLLLGAAGNEFTVAGAPGQISIAGDYSWLQAGDEILIQGATTHANDLIYTVTGAVFVAPDTTITVVEALANVEAAAAGTTLQWVRTHQLCRLVANVAHVWTPASGWPNPCVDSITELLVTNDHATSTGAFQARVVTGPA